MPPKSRYRSKRKGKYPYLIEGRRDLLSERRLVKKSTRNGKVKCGQSVNGRPDGADKEDEQTGGLAICLVMNLAMTHRQITGYERGKQVRAKRATNKMIPRWASTKISEIASH
jgi:hypothetical protein